MQVRPELAFGARALHGRDDPAADDQRADVGSARFLDELLDQDIDTGAAERFDHRLG